MADCTRCGRKLPAFSFGKGSNLCSYCRQAEREDTQPGGHVSQLVPAWRVGPSVTTAIIGVNVAVFLAMTLSGASPMGPTNHQLLHWSAACSLLRSGWGTWPFRGSKAARSCEVCWRSRDITCCLGLLSPALVTLRIWEASSQAWCWAGRWPPVLAATNSNRADFAGSF